MADAFGDRQAGLTSPANYAAAVTPNDDADLANTARALWVGTGGNIALVTAGGSAVTLTNVPGGTMLPVRTARVKATDTTATGIVAVW